VSGVCLFAAEKFIMHVTASYEKHNSERVASFIKDPMFRGWTDLLDRPLSGSLSRLISAGSRFTAYVVRDLLRLILPALTFALALGMLLWIDAGVTLLLTPVVVVYLIPLYLINLGVSRLQSEFRELSSVIRKTATRGWRQMMRHSHSALTKEEVEAGRRDADRLRRIHYRRMLTPKQIQLLNTIFIMVCLLALLVYFTIDSRVHGRPWADLLAYIVALRFAVSALRQVSGTLAKLSRYLPEYRSYARVVDGANRIARHRRELESGEREWPDHLTIRLGSNAAWNSPRRLTMAVDQVLWVLVPESGTLSDAELGAIAARLEHRFHEPINFAGRARIMSDPGLNGHAGISVTAASDAQASCPLIASAKRIRGNSGDGTLVNLLSVPNQFNVLVDSDPGIPLQAERWPALQSIAGVVVLNHRKVMGGGDLDWLRRNVGEIKVALSSLAVPEGQRESDDDDDDDLEE
jgi:ABC-type multidrug transport system fused ATPase/permease subunit